MAIGMSFGTSLPNLIHSGPLNALGLSVWNAIISKTTKQFRAMVFIDTYRKSYMGLLKKPLLVVDFQDSLDPPYWKSTWCHFFAVGGPMWMTFEILVQNDMPTAVIWSKSKTEVEFQYGDVGFPNRK